MQTSDVAEAQLSVADKTWDELGFRLRPKFAKVFVRTDLPPQRIGLIYLPPKEASFYGGLGHQRLVTATVIAVGPLAKSVKVGDRVCFARLHFGHIKQLDDKTYAGWVEQEQIAGFPEDNAVEPFAATGT